MSSEFQNLPPAAQEAVMRTMDAMEPAQTQEEIREMLEGTQKGGVKNSIKNCLTVFQRDPLLRGAVSYNILSERVDIVKPLGWERTSATLTDMDMKYLLLYLEEHYGLTSEKKVENAIQIVGYLLSEDPTYITTHNNARSLIRRIDRDELLAAMVKSYLD